MKAEINRTDKDEVKAQVLSMAKDKEQVVSIFALKGRENLARRIAPGKDDSPLQSSEIFVEKQYPPDSCKQHYLSRKAGKNNRWRDAEIRNPKSEIRNPKSVGSSSRKEVVFMLSFLRLHSGQVLSLLSRCRVVMVAGHPSEIIKRKCYRLFHRVTGLTISRWFFALRKYQPYFLKEPSWKTAPPSFRTVFRCTGDGT